MMIAGAILGPIERSTVSNQTAGGPITPFHDLNVPYQGNEEYETPTAEMLFPPYCGILHADAIADSHRDSFTGTAQTPLPGTAQTPLPGTADSSFYNTTTGGTPITPNAYHSINGTRGVTELQAGRPSPYMQPASAWMNQRPSFGVDVHVAYEKGREELDREISQKPTMQRNLGLPGKRKREDLISQYHSGGHILQQDGAGDAVSDDFQIYNYQGPVNEDYNIANTPALIDQEGTPAVVIQNDVGDDDDDKPLTENDDDDVDNVDQGEEMNTRHLVWAQFEKVTRAKRRWKYTLKDGIMHINNKDILFNKATREFDF